MVSEWWQMTIANRYIILLIVFEDLYIIYIIILNSLPYICIKLKIILNDRISFIRYSYNLRDCGVIE